MPFKKQDVRQRFAAKIRKTPTCWEWTGVSRNGYGQFTPEHDVKVYAHRYSYELNLGPVPQGQMVLHKCDNPLCVRPSHLFVGDAKANAEDRDRKGRLRGGPNRCHGEGFR